jgi:hypothetical protein
VLSRSLKAAAAGDATFAPGQTTKVGATIWEGSNRERGDLRSYTRQWHELTLER